VSQLADKLKEQRTITRNLGENIMSHILWTNHPTNPSLNGTKAHVALSVAEVAVAYEQATLLPRPNYGTQAWKDERAAADANRKPHAGETYVPFVAGVKFGIQDHALLGHVIVRESGSEVARINDPKVAELHGAPKDLCKELEQLLKSRSKQNSENERIAAGNSWGK
jgi:hypothetical protein